MQQLGGTAVAGARGQTALGGQGLQRESGSRKVGQGVGGLHIGLELAREISPLPLERHGLRIRRLDRRHQGGQGLVLALLKLPQFGLVAPAFLLQGCQG